MKHEFQSPVQAGFAAMAVDAVRRATGPKPRADANVVQKASLQLNIAGGDGGD